MLVGIQKRINSFVVYFILNTEMWSIRIHINMYTYYLIYVHVYNSSTRLLIILFDMRKVHDVWYWKQSNFFKSANKYIHIYILTAIYIGKI